MVRRDHLLYLVFDSNTMYTFWYTFGCHIFTFEYMDSNKIGIWMSTLEHIWMHVKVNVRIEMYVFQTVISVCIDCLKMNTVSYYRNLPMKRVIQTPDK